MENQNEKNLATPVEDTPILPDGWTEDMDFFAWANGDVKADEPLAELFAGENTDAGSEEAEELPATDAEAAEDDDSETDDGEQPATPSEPEPQSTTIRFEANINHRKKSVEIDQSELPELFEKAYAVDKFRNKLAAKEQEQEKAAIVSKLLGYKSVDEMLDAARDSYVKNSIDQLVSEKVHPTIAKETVERRVKELEDQAMKDRKPVEPEYDPDSEETASPPERDFNPEVKELISVYPELKGKTLPEEVVRMTVFDGMSLVAAYTKYQQQKTKADNARLQKENRTLKQNAEAAKRAPVRGVAKNGATKLGPDDPFMKGFNSAFA